MTQSETLTLPISERVAELLDRHRGMHSVEEFAISLIEGMLKKRDRDGLEGGELIAALERAGWSEGELLPFRISEELRQDEMRAMNAALEAVV